MLELRHMNFEGRDSTRDSDSMAASDVWEASEPASRAVRKTQCPGCVAGRSGSLRLTSPCIALPGREHPPWNQRMTATAHGWRSSDLAC